jgi:hypothetical protein
MKVTVAIPSRQINEVHKMWDLDRSFNAVHKDDVGPSCCLCLIIVLSGTFVDGGLGCRGFHFRGPIWGCAIFTD